MQAGDVIALVTDSRYIEPTTIDALIANVLADDAALIGALDELGVATRRVSWTDDELDWSQFRAAVVRSTWDYSERIDEYRQWLTKVDASTQLINAKSTLDWNIDKHYLDALAGHGLPVVPTQWRIAGEGLGACETARAQGWEEVVVKPTISASGRDTFRIRADADPASSARVAASMARQDTMIQPYFADIVDRGEVGLVFIAGRYQHAVLKVARTGEFRVQDDHGGRVLEHRANDEQRELAEAAVAHCPGNPTYARVDLVRDPDGRETIMEVELLEPELWLRDHATTATAFAQALVSRVTTTGDQP